MLKAVSNSGGGGGGSGTVTTVSVVTANGFAGSVANPTTTPAITISTTVTGVLYGNGTAVSASKLALTQPATGSTLTIVDGKTLTASNTLTLAGTDSTTMSFPTTSATIARTDAGQTFTGANAFATSVAIGGATIGSNALAVTGTSQIGASSGTASIGVSSGNLFMADQTHATTGGTAYTSTGWSTRFDAVYGWSSGNPGTNDTTLSRVAAGVVGTTRLSLIAGTLGDQAQVFSITATQPASPTGTQSAITATITSAGSANQANYAFFLNYAAGYSGANQAAAFLGNNGATSTGTTVIPAAGSNGVLANVGVLGSVFQVGSGSKIGTLGVAIDGNVNIGAQGLAQGAKNSATNIGVVGSAINTGTSPVMVGGFFSLNQTSVPAVSSALIADNGAQTSAIFLARDNGTTVFAIADGGNVSGNNSSTLSGFLNISMPSSGSIQIGTGFYMLAPSASVVGFRGNGGVGTAVSMITLGPSNTSNTGIKQNGTTLQARLADDSAFTNIQGKLTTDANATTGLAAGVLAATTNATITITDASGQVYRIPCII